jgi:capsule polysaccharide export protein KpsE/RkpR
MENEVKPKEAKFSDYLYVLYKWKRFLIINLIIVGLVTTGLVFLIPNEYKATATIMIPPDNQMGLGGLSSLLGGKSSIASAGSRLFGMASTSEDMLLGILNSRTAVTDVIKKFNLMEYYEIDDNNWDKVIKAFRSDFSTDPNEFGMIDFSIVNKDPNVSAKIANYLVTLVDSMNIEFSIQRARNNRIFIEKRYFQNVADLKKAEDSLYKFQKKYGIVAVPEQLEVTVKAAAEIESALMKKEMESFFVLQGYGENSPQYQGIKSEIKLLKDKVQEIKNSPNLSATSNVLFPFKEMPNIAIQYLRTYREVEIQQSILEIVMPMYEQAKVEEQKSMPTIMLMDKAIAPELKHSPKRSVIILGVLFLLLLFLIPFIFWGEKAVGREKFQNPLQIKEANLFNRILKIYRMKF